MPYFLYEVTIYKITKKSAILLESKLYKLSKLISVKTASKKYKDYSIVRNVSLIGVPSEFIRKNKLKEINERTR